MHSVEQRVQQACRKADRARDSVKIIAVSKTMPLNAIEEAYAAGQRHFAENYAQEALAKQSSAQLEQLDWHFIGPLQSNKCKPVAQTMDWVQTVDRIKIAQRLSTYRPQEMAPLKVLIQVNISQDSAKAGVSLAAVPSLAAEIQRLPNLQLRGLMAITANGLSNDLLRADFTALKACQTTLESDYPECTECSMGMSSDYELAIDCGATMVRVGRDIFGARNTHL